MPPKTLWEAHERINQWLGQRVGEAYVWCGRVVKLIDGCGLSMPDTDQNRARWPYAGGQKPCGQRGPGRVLLYSDLVGPREAA